MKYLKLIDSFDEFAEDAKSGTVYYDIGDSVYYWLNLRSIWGYIGYDRSNNAFYTNGRIWSIVPAVPDPENLLAPVTISSDSFVTVPDTITFKYSPFDIVPIENFNGYSGKIVRYIVECNNDYSPTKIVGGTNNVEIEIKDASWESLQTISGKTPYLIFTDTNGLIDLSTINSSRGQDWAYLVTEKESTSISEDVFFKNISQGIQRQKDWPTIFWVKIPDGTTEHVLKLHQIYSGNKPIYRVLSIPSSLTDLIIDGTDSQGVMDDSCWQYLEPDSTYKYYFRNISYVNVSDYGGYYKRYLLSDNLLEIPTEILNFWKTKNCALYCDTKHISGSARWYITSQDWKNFTDTEYNLSGVKYIDYYKNASIEVSGVGSYYTIGSVSLTENDIEENRVCGGSKKTVLATPKFNNINLNSFSFFGNIRDNKSNISPMPLYIRTDDQNIYLGNLTGVNNSFHVNNKHIYISGIGVVPGGEGSLNISVYGQDFTGNIIFENYQPHMVGNRPTVLNLRVDCGGNDAWALANRTNNPIFVLSNSPTTQNPTPEDYYNTGLNTVVGSSTNDVKALFNRKMFDIDLIYGSDIGYTSKTNKLYTPADWSSIKSCYPRYAYIDTMYVGDSSSSVEAGSAQINTLIAAVPNITAYSNNAAFYFSSTQYALLSSTQINYLTGLGYLVIERI